MQVQLRSQDKPALFFYSKGGAGLFLIFRNEMLELLHRYDM